METMGKIRMELNRKILVVAAVAVFLAGITGTRAVWAQAQPATPGDQSVSLPVPTTEPLNISAPISATPPTTEPVENANSFVGQISATNVNVRSGPSEAYYAVGQLDQGDLVQVMGTKNGWYRIAPPEGTKAYIARQFVKLSEDGTTGVVTGDFVNVRAASPITPESNFAIIAVEREGTELDVSGQTDQYYIIDPPANAGFYIISQFVKPAPAGVTYIAPQIKLPPGVNPEIATVTPPTTAPATTQEGIPIPPAPGQTNNPPATQTAIQVPPMQPVPTPVPVPAKNYNSEAYTTYAQLNNQAEEEWKKPLLQRNLDPLLEGYQDLLAQPNLPPSVQEGSKARLDAIKNAIAIQNIYKANQQTPPINQVIAPYQQQWQASQDELQKAMETAPFLAKGILKASDSTGNYALIDPDTGRVAAYVEPSTSIDLSKLVGSYIGVKGDIVNQTGTVINVIDAESATLLPNPTVGQ
ncbi:MAG TPA: SH3 domain-containing protein [Phycisphaerae bacterium]|nr:SH3 domain-containing protein [Phycisphaerae bacterium]